ncbi:PEP-utilizing enzyme [Solirubrobacter taibaiensis]|nr:PEP-utilizing enzyme [Solirubrobacter taibaiensis]
MTLASLPSPPTGVAYALTVPQSVLFADLSLRGSRRPAFQTVFGVDYEVPWVVIDDGAMSWDFSGDPQFSERLLGTLDPAVAVRRFVSTMGMTSRALEKTASLLGPSAGRRLRMRQDLLADLNECWDAYERQMTSLFTFWNVEQLLSGALVDLVKAMGFGADVNAGLQRFLQPSELNYFAVERRHLVRIAKRFHTPQPDVPDEAEPRERALEYHANAFGFLLAPFNLGVPPSSASLIERLHDAEAALDDPLPLITGRPDALLDVDEPLRELALLAQELTFWKTERLDVMSLADARIAPLYMEASAVLKIDLDQLFAMTRDEIDESLRCHDAIVEPHVLSERRRAFCMLLSAGEIAFFLPSGPAGVVDSTTSTIAGEISGIGASSGTVSGRVRRILDLDRIGTLEPGEILVTTMTRPEMGVALDRAAAFVTDQGGRMSHAAIIAREMGKPCVIGTETATSVLSDGMVVTVDGDRGVVTLGEGENAG